MNDVVRSNQNDGNTLEVSFSVEAAREVEDWEKNHFCAEYLAEYAKLALANVQDTPVVIDMTDRVNYIANELLEAAMLGQVTPKGQISVRLQLTDENILLNVQSNHSADRLASLKKLAKLASVKNPDAVYLDRLLDAEMSHNAVYSDIRFLSMMVDCDAKIDMLINEDVQQDETLSVTTMTSVSLA